MRKQTYLKDKNQTNLFADLQSNNKPHQHIEEQSLRKKDAKDSTNIKYLKKRAMEYRKEQCGLNNIGGSCIHRREECAGEEHLQEYLDRYIKLKWVCSDFRHECAPRRNSNKE